MAITTPISPDNGDEFFDALRHIRQKEWIRDVWKEKEPTCIYCGDWHQVNDHYHACSWQGVRFNNGNTVPSCEECIYLLSNRPIFTISDRCRFLIKKYQ